LLRARLRAEGEHANIPQYASAAGILASLSKIICRMRKTPQKRYPVVYKSHCPLRAITLIFVL
jgi:hypothetical protein